MYDPRTVQPMRDELVSAGVRELRTPEEVDGVLSRNEGTTLVFVNSVCGCSAGTARPGLIRSLGHPTVPENVVTVFAGVDNDAVARVRSRITGYPPSSPSVALFREGRLVDMIRRQDIEIRTAEELAHRLTQAYDRWCGPEVDDSVEIEDPLADLEITPSEVHEMMRSGTPFEFLDVRTERERVISSIEGTRHLSEELLVEILETWPRDTKIVLHCHTGVRSLEAAEFLRLHQGFKDVRSMAGGINAWSATVDSTVPAY